MPAEPYNQVMSEKNNQSVGEATVYDYTAEQREVLELYRMRDTALVGRKYHGQKVGPLLIFSRAVDSVAAIAGSTGIAGLLGSFQSGNHLFQFLLGISALASVFRAAFRANDAIERHSNLATLWGELFLDMDNVAIGIACDEKLTDARRQQIKDLSERFRRIETHDEPYPNPAVLSRIETEVQRAMRTEKAFLPAR